MDVGETARAVPYLERSLAIAEKTYGPQHPEVAARLHNLGVALRDAGDLPRAAAAMERGLAIHDSMLGPDHPEVGGTLDDLGTHGADTGGDAPPGTIVAAPPPCRHGR